MSDLIERLKELADRLEYNGLTEDAADIDDAIAALAPVDDAEVREACMGLGILANKIFAGENLGPSDWRKLDNARALIERLAREKADAEAALAKAEYAFNLAIDFTLKTDSPKEFLNCWNEGDWEALENEWPEFNLGVIERVQEGNHG